jgi:glycosyltransferase involved in cell wall biosynthesis
MINNFPKITIVTPNYNQVKFLEQTIQSVLEQNYPNLEYIIIDGGSTDGSVDIIKKYARKLAYWVSEPDKGLYDAVKKGFDKSTGEIMAWINSDDMYHRNAFYIVAEVFSSFHNVDWIQGLPAYYDEQGRSVWVDSYKQWSKHDYYSGEYEWIQQESTFWRRSLWEKVAGEFNTSYKYAGDLALWTLFFRHASLYSMACLLSGFRFRSSNQLSLEHLADYHVEAGAILQKETLSAEDKKIVKRYLFIKKIVRCLAKLKISHTYWLTKLYKKKFFKYPQKIEFNRISQQFELIE